MIISLIAAMDRNRLIGQGELSPLETALLILRHFRELTLDKPVVMGTANLRIHWQTLAQAHQHHLNARPAFPRQADAL